jgi:hypothetical protein
MLTESEAAKEPLRAHQRFNRTIIAAVLFVTALAAYVISGFIPQNLIPPALKEFFLALTAAMAVHLLDRLWLYRDTLDSLEQLRKQIVGNVASETGALIGQLDARTKQALKEILDSVRTSMKSLEAMGQSGIVQLYANREEASADISRDLASEHNQSIRLIGISLNDFLLRKDSTLGQAWESVLRYIQSKPTRTLEIKILLIDPLCLAAQLRSKGEERTGKFIGRLKRDVDIAIDELLELEETCKKYAGVSVECRLYRLAPTLFLCLTDSVSYVEQYYFWSARAEKKAFPIFKFQNIQTTGGSMHAELNKHFDWIWEKASIRLAEYRNDCSLGVDKGVQQSGIVNIFTDPDDGLARMGRLLAIAKQKVSIQGISLHSFFNRSSQVYPTISRLLMDDKVDVEILFLNPTSEQAKFRAYREYSFDNPNLTRDMYEDGRHRSSSLYLETMAAKNELEAMVREIRPRKAANWQPKLKVGFYDSAPHCFLLRVDEHMFVEQYHYGKLSDDQHGARTILGKDQPLVEYGRLPHDIFEQMRKTPFALLESHFEFALKEAELLPVEQWGAVAHGGTFAAQPTN